MPSVASTPRSSWPFDNSARRGYPPSGPSITLLHLSIGIDCEYTFVVNWNSAIINNNFFKILIALVFKLIFRLVLILAIFIL